MRWRPARLPYGRAFCRSGRSAAWFRDIWTMGPLLFGLATFVRHVAAAQMQTVDRQDHMGRVAAMMFIGDHRVVAFPYVLLVAAHQVDMGAGASASGRAGWSVARTSPGADHVGLAGRPFRIDGRKDIRGRRRPIAPAVASAQDRLRATDDDPAIAPPHASHAPRPCRAPADRWRQMWPPQRRPDGGSEGGGSGRAHQYWSGWSIR